MKQFVFFLLFAAITSGILLSCSSDDTEDNNTPPVPEVPPVEPGTNRSILIAYFTMPETDGVDAVSGASRTIVNNQLYGNTHYIAELIREITQADIMPITTVQQYPGNHGPLVSFAREEKDAGRRPELSAVIEDFDQYDIIFVGYPVWYSDMPMPVYTFLEQYDFNGKTIVPFATHGGNGFSSTVANLTRLRPDATVVTNGYNITRNNVAGARNSVASWLEDIGVLSGNDYTLVIPEYPTDK